MTHAILNPLEAIRNQCRTSVFAGGRSERNYLGIRSWKRVASLFQIELQPGKGIVAQINLSFAFGFGDLGWKENLSLFKRDIFPLQLRQFALWTNAAEKSQGQKWQHLDVILQRVQKYLLHDFDRDSFNLLLFGVLEFDWLNWIDFKLPLFNAEIQDGFEFP